MYHSGGGFVTNTTSSHRKMVGHLAKAANCKALNLGYRLAPEVQFPSQIDDGVAAYKWLLTQGYKPSNIATAGDSAGGNLATAVVLKLRDLKEPLPAAIIGFSPWYDMESQGGTMESNNESDALVHAETLTMMKGMFLGDHDPKDPLANLLLADPKGLPPMYLAAGGFETLLDNAERFAKKAKDAGVDVELEVSPGMQHVYVFMAGNAKEADGTLRNVGNWVQGKFGN
jgi:monoterpene epsilon-lactone hydrolase